MQTNKCSSRVRHDRARPSVRSVPPCARGAKHVQAETSAREIGRLGLLDALDYLTLLAAEAPERYDRTAKRWLARLLAESTALTLDEVTVALGCLRGLAAGYGEHSREVGGLARPRLEANG
jgi:hypothetical protein